jgi:protein involved in polysaccharide export with SLBB domain
MPPRQPPALRLQVRPEQVLTEEVPAVEYQPQTYDSVYDPGWAPQEFNSPLDYEAQIEPETLPQQQEYAVLETVNLSDTPPVEPQELDLMPTQAPSPTPSVPQQATKKAKPSTESQSVKSLDLVPRPTASPTKQPSKGNKTPKPTTPATRTAKSPLRTETNSAQVNPGILIHLSSSEDSSITGDYRIEFDGALRLPYQVVIQAAGLTLPELKTAITYAYHIYFANPEAIEVSVTERRALVEVRGQVNKPGRYLVETQADLEDLLELAGGLKKKSGKALAKYVSLSRGNQSSSYSLERALSEETNSKFTPWQGGESVFFLEKR